MTSRHFVLIAVLLVPRWSSGQIEAGAVALQTPEITLETQAKTTQLRQWLHSGDPRLIAWGATLARVHGDAAVLADASEILSHWPTDPMTRRTLDGPEQQDAMAVLLDAMIQLKGPAAFDTIQAVQERFPAQAVVLAIQAPEAVRMRVLHHWLDGLGLPGVQPTRAESSLRRIAAMFAAEAPPPGFAAGLLNSADEHVAIAIGEEGVKCNRYDRFNEEFGCGVSVYVPRTQRPGWPVIYLYHLEEDPVTRQENASAPGGAVVEAGGARITWRRVGPDDWPGGCGVGPLTSRTRHSLLAQMLDEPESALPWPVTLNRTIVWRDEQQVQMEIGKIIAEESAKQRQTLLDLMARGLILPDEMKNAMPSIRLDIEYGATVPSR